MTLKRRTSNFSSPRKLRLWNNLLAVLILVTATPLGVAPDGKFHKPFGAMAALETTSLQRRLQREEAFAPPGRLWPPYQIWVREATHLVSGVCVNSVAYRKLYIVGCSQKSGPPSPKSGSPQSTEQLESIGETILGYQVTTSSIC